MANKPMTSRRAAHESLMKISKGGRYSNIEIDSYLKSSDNMSDSDRALYTRLVYGVIERQITLDHIIAQYTTREITDIDEATLTSLRLGIYQMVYMDRIPEFAAVSETVDTAPSRSRGFVNGVLRSFIRGGKKFSLPCGSTPADLSVRFSTSAGICCVLVDSYGADTAERILEAFFSPGKICLRINTLKTSVCDVMSQLEDAETGTYSEDIVKVTSLTEEVRAGLVDGRWFVQDEASRICTKVLDAKPGERVADVCSAPGGKSFSAAIDMKNCGEVHSFDLHGNKLSLISKTADRLGLDVIGVSQRDARDPDPELIGKCDRVLCDAPCSGIGVLAKKPEIRYKAAESADRLPQIQYDVLCGASSYVKDGGVLVYSTCTLNKRENENVVDRFLKTHPEFSPLDFECGVAKSEDGMLTLFPHVHGTDGFFVAKLIKHTL